MRGIPRENKLIALKDELDHLVENVPSSPVARKIVQARIAQLKDEIPKLQILILLEVEKDE